MAHHMTLLAQFLSHCPCALSGPAQGRLRIPPGGRFDQGLQCREEGRVVLLDEMPASPRSSNSLGRQVVPLLELVPTGRDCGPGQAGSFSHEAHATAS